MGRKGFASVEDFRGMLAVPSDIDESEFERAGYVSALRAAKASDWGPR